MKLNTWEFMAGDVVHNHFDVKLEEFFGTVEGLEVWLCHYIALDISIEVAFDPEDQYELLATTPEYFGEEE